MGAGLIQNLPFQSQDNSHHTLCILSGIIKAIVAFLGSLHAQHVIRVRSSDPAASYKSICRRSISNKIITTTAGLICQKSTTHQEESPHVVNRVPDPAKAQSVP